MAVTLYIKDGRKFNIEDLRDVLPSCKLAVDYASLEQQLATLRAEIKSRVASRVAEFRAEVEGEMDALKAKNERLLEEWNIQNKCIADLHDTIRELHKALGGGA
jgi:hypothetical protein